MIQCPHCRRRLEPGDLEIELAREESSQTDWEDEAHKRNATLTKLRNEQREERELANLQSFMTGGQQ